VKQIAIVATAPCVLHQMRRTSRITASVRERAQKRAMIAEQPEKVIAMVREAIKMLTAMRG
jgi:hypothetical protein